MCTGLQCKTVTILYNMDEEVAKGWQIIMEWKNQKHDILPIKDINYIEWWFNSQLHVHHDTLGI